MSAPANKSNQRPADDGGLAARALAPRVRAWADGARAPGQGDRQETQWIALENALAVRAQKAATAGRERAAGALRRGAPVALAAALVVAAAAAIALRSRGGGEPALTFVVADAPARAAGELGATQAPARLAFSDGSEVVLERGTRASIVHTTAHGARVRLDDGRARFSVIHRSKTDWAADAGPFTVVVHGTVFDLGWSNARGALAVDLVAGNVTVAGPFPGGSVALRAGDRLTADAAGRFHVAALGEPERGATTAGDAITATAPDAPNAPAPAEPSDEHRARARTGAVASEHATARRLADRLAELAAAWPGHVAAGSFASVLDEAKAAGFERSLDEVPAAALAALADAARYARRADLAERALLAERRRFDGTAAACDAAFLIGRLVEDGGHDAGQADNAGNAGEAGKRREAVTWREAVSWYDRYLAESRGAAGRRGTYDSEALGRKMLALDRLGESAKAERAADEYLRDFPAGVYAARAERVRARR